MKILILILVLANLGMLAWNQWFVEAPEKPAAAAIYEGLPEIVLASEAEASEDVDNGPQLFEMATGPQGPATASAGDTTPAAQLGNAEEIVVAVAETAVGNGAGQAADLAEEVVMTCRSIGPFDRDEEALTASETLAGLGFTINPRAEQEQRQVGFWVSIPSLADRPSAEQIAADLRNAGISDFYIVPSGEDQNAISLGVFSQRERADRRATQVRDSGFASEVTGRFQPANVTWLEIRGPNADSLDSGVLGAGDRPLEIRSDCEAF